MKDLTLDNRKNALENQLKLREPTPIELFLKSPSRYTFKRIPKRFQTEKLIEVAVSRDGMSLGDVSKKLISLKLCQKAIEQNGRALEYVPASMLSKELCEQAVQSNGCALQYVPAKWVTAELERQAVEHTPANCYNPPIAHIPIKRLSAELSLISVQKCPRSLGSIKQKYMSNKLLIEALKRDGRAIEYVPEKKLTDELIELALSSNLNAWNYIPENRKEGRFGRQLLEKFHALVGSMEEKHTEDEDVKEDNFGDTREAQSVFSLQAIPIELPVELPNEYTLVKKHRNKSLCNFGNEEQAYKVPVYYISDIHLEFQLKPVLYDGITCDELSFCIDKKIKEMVKGADWEHGILLVAGDVAHSVELTRMFYICLKKLWRGKVFAVLGNHELWDGITEINEPEACRSLHEIEADYFNYEPYRIYEVVPPIFLENSLYIYYKNRKNRIIDEQTLLDASERDLADICEKSTILILGGTGYSGLNPYYNAEIGLYRNSVRSLEEDRLLSSRFLAVYNKVEKCARNRTVIVLTHNPVHDWMKKTCNPNWIYVNGHTHRNALIRKKDGTTVLSDNQVGYKPKKWKLSCFTISGWYDSFQRLEDGIYKINAEQYDEFNQLHGIASENFKSQGDIYALKRSGVYLFMLQSKAALSLLEGGKRYKVNHQEIDYYYDNMLIYHDRVIAAIRPYHEAITMLSEEVKRFGGDGTVHGCIVDISFFSHLYLNPYDGKVTAYWATITSWRTTYDSVLELIQMHEADLMSRYLEEAKKGNLPLLEQYTGKHLNENDELATIPLIVLGREIYEPSRLMRAIQYMFDQNVIRIWNDDILTEAASILDLPKKETLQIHV